MRNKTKRNKEKQRKKEEMTILFHWLNESNNKNLDIYGYELIQLNRENKNKKRGGGVAIYIDISLNYIIMNQLSIKIQDSVEILTIKILIKNNQHLLSTIYRSPSYNVDTFIDLFYNTFNNINNKIFILGDLNINILSDNIYTNKFKDNLEILGF